MHADLKFVCLLSLFIHLSAGKHQIHVTPNHEWTEATNEFTKRAQNWSSTIKQFIEGVQRRKQLSMYDIQAVYSRCAGPKHLDATIFEDNPFIIPQTTYCSERPQLKLLIVVHSHPANHHRRDLVRSTWGSLRRVGPEKIGVLFFLGSSEKTQKAVKEEAETYRDIVQRNFTEDYHNMTHKHLTIMEWLSMGHCASLQYIVKVDDDTFVDIFHLVRFLRSDQLKTSPGFYCSATKGAKPTRPKKGVPETKWVITKEEFDKDVFPVYCEGLGYIVEARVAPFLYLCSMFTQTIWIDDVYVTGILAEKLGISRQAFLPGHAYDRAGPSKQSGELLDNIFLTSYHSEFIPETFRRLWHSAVAMSMDLGPN
ncbi:hypothetical protein T265_15493 [Opisthorchis viverrini]|uniref:Hexosyltransferase n=1 Tax=Opisthorchis viverrini TaxID=6198 RepID=A0A074YXT4_OPIVI|nr:hypothetical protein T265_15493 [Opisthorchis viverrini]KER19606.1 hypothetical protein T265_15493 [Opisthorchis viverrini]